MWNLVALEKNAQIVTFRALSSHEVSYENESLFLITALLLFIEVTSGADLHLGVKLLQWHAPLIENVALEFSIVCTKLACENFS